MAQAETNVSKKVELAASRLNFTMFRNNTGYFYAIQNHKFREDRGFVEKLNKYFRLVQAGLGKGTSDLIGWREVTVTPDMVGKKVAIFTALEVKTKTGRASAEQLNFIDVVNRNGGIAQIAKGEEDLDGFK